MTCEWDRDYWSVPSTSVMVSGTWLKWSDKVARAWVLWLKSYANNSIKYQGTVKYTSHSLFVPSWKTRFLEHCMTHTDYNDYKVMNCLWCIQEHWMVLKMVCKQLKIMIVWDFLLSVEVVVLPFPEPPDGRPESFQSCLGIIYHELLLGLNCCLTETQSRFPLGLSISISCL